MGALLKQHPRVPVVQQAFGDLAGAVAKAVDDYSLTYGELTRILAQLQERWAVYQVRDERHPNDPDHPADTA